MRWKVGAAMPVVLLLASGAVAQENRSLIYGGVGQASDDEFEVDTLPWSLGFMLQPATSRFAFGFDIGGEGTKLDSTFGQDSLKQARSYNLLLGGNVATTGDTRIDAGLLLGARETVQDCPDSFLGYQCYADEEPDTEYEVNYGVVVSVSYRRAMFGVRATGESVQALVGFRF